MSLSFGTAATLSSLPGIGSQHPRISTRRPGQNCLRLIVTGRLNRVNCHLSSSSFFSGKALPSQFKIETTVINTMSINRQKTVAQVTFKAKRTLSLSCQETSIPIDTYLANVERVVNVAFPDRKRLQLLAPNTWRARLKPVTFFSISATPVCDLRAWFERGFLRIFSDKVVLDLAGLPPQFHNIKLNMTLEGRLQALRRGAPKVAASPACQLEGYVNLGVSLDLPVPFNLIPEPAVNAVGNAILDGILAAMQGALLRGLLQDYYMWSKEQVELRRRTGQVNLK
eukprot:jgi/Mesen1/7195/ME000371S06277